MIQHQVELHDLHAHLFRVTLTLTKPQAGLRVALPVWIPGSYLVREFSKHVQEMQAYQGRVRWSVRQLSKNTWELNPPEQIPEGEAHPSSAEALQVSYKVYGFDASVRTAYLDVRGGFFNGTALFLRVLGRESEPQQVLIQAPIQEGPHQALNQELSAPSPEASSQLPSLGWRVATALRSVCVDEAGWGTYQADHYDELVDSPFQWGAQWEGSFVVRGVRHRVVVDGALPSFDAERLLADTQRITETALAFWHGATGAVPQDLREKGYVFMLRAVDDGYGGLEHMHSTALITKRSDLPRLGESALGGDAPQGYVTLLGLISHEYFHTWNVKRLRPCELRHYDYDRENFTELLWFFEGFTSYYDDLLLRRAGLITSEQYVHLLERTINQVLRTPGRWVHSLAGSSLEAWTKYYRMDENSVNSTVSYYTKGALVALCLDVMLRQQAASLDAVMQQLWQRYCADKPDLIGAIDEAAVLQAVSSQALSDEFGGALRDLLRSWVQTTNELPLAEVLRAVGVEMVPVAASWAQQLGVRVRTEGGLHIKQVMQGSLAASAGFAAGDEWIAIEVANQAWRITCLDDLKQYLPISSQGRRATAAPSLIAWVARDRQILKLQLALPVDDQVNADIRLQIVEAEKLERWLGAGRAF